MVFSTPRDNKALIYSHEPGSGSVLCKLKQTDFELWDFDGLCLYEHIPQYGDPERDELEILIENKANLISFNFIRKKIFKRFLIYFNQAYEMGINTEGIRRQIMRQITPSIADCVPQKPPVTHDRGSLPFDLYNYKFSFALIVMLYSIALVILMFETWYHRHYSSDNISHEVIEISVQWKRSNENHSSIASTVQTMEYKDDFVKNLIQSVANKKSKPTDVKSGHNSETERHRSKICTTESNAIETDSVETNTVETDAIKSDSIKTGSIQTDTKQTDTIKTGPTHLNHTPKMVTHVAVAHSTSQIVSSGKKVEKKFGRNRIVPIFDDRMLTEVTQTRDRNRFVFEIVYFVETVDFVSVFVF